MSTKHLIISPDMTSTMIRQCIEDFLVNTTALNRSTAKMYANKWKVGQGTLFLMMDRLTLRDIFDDPVVSQAIYKYRIEGKRKLE